MPDDKALEDFFTSFSSEAKEIVTETSTGQLATGGLAELLRRADSLLHVMHHAWPLPSPLSRAPPDASGSKQNRIPNVACNGRRHQLYRGGR